MKYKDTDFRSIVGKTFVIDAVDFKPVIKSLPGNEKADVLLTYGYIDHEAGVTLEVLAAGNKTENGYVFSDPEKESMTKIRMHSIEDYELTEIELNNERFAEKIAIVKMYDDNPEVAQSREFEFLDHLRDKFCIDDVLVYLYKDELELEGCWVRIEGLLERSFIGTLLNEPNQDFGYHEGDRISFIVQQMEDNSIVAVSNMNPSANLTKKDLEDGSMLKEAIAAFNNERTQEHLLDVLELLRDSDVWIPCNAVVSKQDEEKMLAMIKEKEENGEDIVGSEFTNSDQIRMIPDILQSDDEFFFPVFSSQEEMGEYGDHFSKVPATFLHAISLARNNEKDVKGIVINAFTDPFVLNKDIFDVVENMKSRIVNNHEG